MGKMRRAFSPEFKQEAVRQVTELGHPHLKANRSRAVS